MDRRRGLSRYEDSSDEEGRRRDHEKKKSKDKEKKPLRHKKGKSSKGEHKKSRDERKRKHRSKYSSDDGSSDSEISEDRRKKRKHKSRHISDDSSDSEASDERRKKRKHKSRHVSDDSSDSETSDDRKKKRLLKEAKKLIKKHKSKTSIVPMEPAPAGLKVDNISDEDYFAKSVEFAMWLKEARGLFFSNLSSEETHKLFGTFVGIWNAGKLSAKYYQGIKAAPRTSHKWGIKLDTNEHALLGKDEDDIIQEKKLQKLERKKYKKDQEVLMDELLPKATGREAMLEKKALRREQARAREDSPENFKEKDVMGGGDDFQQRLARERAWREKKAAAKTEVYMEKRNAFEEKEAAAMNQFKAMVNMSGGKIIIPKRNDAT